MFSLVRKRLGVPGILAVFALVFAMAGGAWAAKKYVITSTSQIKPSVLKQLKGNVGPPGPAGAPGAAGPKGDTGAAGERGAKGATGAKGDTGSEGSPWTAGGVLPSGKTETGAWSFGRIAAGAVPVEPLEESLIVPISFNIPLASTLAGANVHYLEKEAAPTTDCPGSAADPKAAAGHLCVYTGSQSPGPPAGAEATFQVGAIQNPGNSPLAGGAAKSGAVMIVFIAKAKAFAAGTWAVTAP